MGCVQGDGQTLGRPSLLVVDSLSFLVSPVMGPGGADDGHALMICLGRALKALAQRHTLAVITTNHIVGGGAPQHLPASYSAWAGSQQMCQSRLVYMA